ncbi:carboxylesterase/lipase family protein [Actinomadura craniellae]|uniref:carboxylesterase/lipase family protein n=1 Tax=Actinomadura craniellae TaxID=2231787 RepID=UPI001F3626B7|nr:carboxylesterase/lipase family protein [Actinomadura craniellae]
MSISVRVRRLAVLLAAPLAAGALAVPAAAEEGPTVRIRDGAVRGTAGATANSYLGIPYAAPPVGPLRWKPPAPPARWQGVRDGSEPGNPCMQRAEPTPWGNLAGPGTPGEDCLYLNVYTPKKRAAHKRPVMLWIHGGGFTIGSGTFYEGSNLADRGDAVVVNFNYRLGAFGYFAHPDLATESAEGISGNYGLLDQQAALRWVRDNIAAFGGDPGNVTIFGESAGGGSVCQNLVSPRTRGLFDRAIAQSGCGFPLPTQDAQQGSGAAWAAGQGCTDVACMRGKTAEQVLAASLTPAVRWTPVVDGKVMPLQIQEALDTGRFHRVPVVQGTTADEGRLTVASTYDLAGRRLTAEGYPAAVRQFFGDRADAILARYPLSDYPSPAEALGAILTHAQFSCLSYRTTESMAKHTRAYGYEFADPNAMAYLNLPISFPVGAAHGSEIRYIFGNVSGTPEQNALADRMLGYWTNFAKTGVPYAAGAPRWDRFPKVQVLAPAAIAPTTTFPQDHKCDLWTPS